MSETYTNRYVIEITSGHPGYTDYNVIATRDDMREMVVNISEALEKSDEELIPKWQVDGETTSFPLHKKGDPITLWSGYVTVAKGSTERRYLRFSVTEDLAPYHIRNKRTQILDYVVWFGLAVALFFVLIGVLATITIVRSLFGY